MSEHENVERVQAVYAAFGRGDIVAFMDALTDDVVWEVLGPSDLPWFGTFHGKAGVREWLGMAMENLRFQVLEAREFIAQEDKVVALVRAEVTVTRTGRDFGGSEAHVWTLRDGKAARQQSYLNTAAVADTYRGR